MCLAIGFAAALETASVVGPLSTSGFLARGTAGEVVGNIRHASRFERAPVIELWNAPSRRDNDRLFANPTGARRR